MTLVPWEPEKSAGTKVQTEPTDVPDFDPNDLLSVRFDDNALEDMNDDPIRSHKKRKSKRNTTKVAQWSSWSHKKIVKLVQAANGAAMRDTKLIFVMGKSGTGKTTLLQELTGLKLGIGHGSGSGTLQYQVCPAVIDREQYLFVDTAGFGAGDMDNVANFNNIASCLMALGSFVTVAGVLFVYGEPGSRVLQDDSRTIHWIQCFCGPKFFSNITIITTNWDNLNQTSYVRARRRVTEATKDESFAQILKPPGCYLGGSMYHHGLLGGELTANPEFLDVDEDGAQRGDEIRNLVRQRYKGVKPAEPQIMRELKEGLGLMETEAGKALKGDPTKRRVAIEDDRAVVVDQVPVHNAVYDGDVAQPSVPQGNNAGPSSSAKRNINAKTSMPRYNNEHTPAEPSDESIFKGIVRWLGVGFQAAVFFFSAQKTGYESGNKNNNKDASGWSPWSWFRGWWR
ncbi:hypothetical protein PT974_07367 [Cladobotryum mycophilum]|uniref:G domain-containing protein n=1 Tax=Cladobotryum mycophilum TaxID=491253 RepID=A0ABR0SPA1_9HYPO